MGNNLIRPLGNHMYEKISVVNGKIVVRHFTDMKARLRELCQRVEARQKSIDDIEANRRGRWFRTSV